MRINDKYIVDFIISAIYTSNSDYLTPDEQCNDFSYDDRDSITILELRNILNDIFGNEKE